MKVYRGDSFPVIVTATDENGTAYKFKVGDIVRVGVKKTTEETTYMLFKELVVTSEADAVQLDFTPNETHDVATGKFIIEAELTYNGGQSRRTIYQKPIEIGGDVVR